MSNTGAGSGAELLQINEVTSTDGRIFEVAVQRLVHAIRSGNASGDLLYSMIVQLDTSLTGSRERDRRVRYLLNRATPDHQLLSSIAKRAYSENLHSKNAIMLCLPPHLRQELYKSDEAVTPPENPLQVTAQHTTDALIAKAEAPKESETRAVILLGMDETHHANSALLEANQFTPLPCLRADQLDELLSTPHCGIVVGGSWWKQHGSGDHKKALQQIYNASSFPWIRIDVDHLDAAACRDLPTIQRSIRGGDPTNFIYGSGCSITEADIPSLAYAAGLIHASSCTRFHPSELAEQESMLLRLAATAHVRGHQPDTDARLQVLETSFFSNGRSQAKTVLVQPNDGGVAFVVKIGELSALRDEMKRFKTHIDRIDGRTHPELYFHGGMGAIVFNLIDGADSPGSPAPTLHQRIDMLINSELGSWGEKPPNATDLKTALTRVVAKLSSLNKHSLHAEVNNYGWMVGTIANVGGGSVTWRITGPDNAFLDIPALAQQALDRVQNLDGRATTHGDVHLHNILVSDDRDPYLIDYAHTGPGHPCFDLVRLNAAVMYRAFRMTESEDRIAEFLYAIHVEGHDLTQLEHSFPDLLSATGNQLAAHTGIAVRKECLEILQEHSGGIDDYIAMQLLIACHALTMIEPQSGIVRAMIRALARHLLSPAA